MRIYGGEDRYNYILNGLHPSENGSGFVPSDKWLTLPYMGHIVATYYDRHMVEITSPEIEISETFFPIRCRPPINPKSHIMCLGLILSNFVPLFLKDDCSLPPSSTEWKIHKSEEAASWKFEFWINMIASEHSWKLKEERDRHHPKKFQTKTIQFRVTLVKKQMKNLKLLQNMKFF